MRWDWLLDRHPEVAHLPPTRQQALREAVRWKFLKDRRTWLLCLPLSLVPLAGVIVSQWVLPLSVTSTYAFWVSLPLVFLGAFVAQFRFNRAVVRDALRDELLRRGIRPARCFDCGYDLHSIESDRCPECGAVI